MTAQTAQSTQSRPLPQAPSTLERWFPIAIWLPNYNWGKNLSLDLIAAVTDLLNYTQRYGVELALARVHSGTHKLLQLAGVMDEIGEQRIYTTVRSAVDAAVQQNKAATI
jgi:hypothetical protein